MSKVLLAFAGFTVGSVALAIHAYLADHTSLLERSKLIQIIITLRKSMFSTLREIAYVANCMRIMDSGIEPKKIKQIMTKDGVCAEEKLNTIEELVLARFGITRQIFEKSCHQHSHKDVQIKLLLQSFRNDIQNAIEGTIESYYGHLPEISWADTIKIHREITSRRMRIIIEKLMNGIDNTECLKLEFEIQQYLQGEKVFHEKQANEKVFIALLEYHYKTNSEFQREFFELQRQYEDFIEQIKQRKSR